MVLICQSAKLTVLLAPLFQSFNSLSKTIFSFTDKSILNLPAVATKCQVLAESI